MRPFIEELIRGLIHDLGAPARHIVFFSNMLNEQVKEGVSEKHKQWLNFINEGGTNIQTMLNSLEFIDQISQQASQHDSVDLKPLFEQELSLLTKNHNYSASDIECTISGDWPVIEASKMHWQTLFSCLLDNALTYQPKDEKPKICLTAHLQTAESQLTFFLDDNGIGLSKEQQTDITRPFKRLHSHDDYPGLGMGLSYCKLIAELHNASLRFERSPTGGLRVIYQQRL
ncbi:sensor histidine kinase [Reinekea thalattae]|uniref:histidine kinase n=1 Tax=Reinekea thalattae TaxID=2593301 RepID=A0A5C8ZBF0_9GAMM|nr:ATP-binding protein [Reinekea thalattae]TXR54483.1 hypothetical protein FME95_08095 [Reinekea thalattae]